jgi:adenylate kinase family enzyme
VKIAVLGYSGSGKSTLARELAGLYNIPVLYLDTVQFIPGWVERDKDEACSMVREFMRKNESWVIDGNYTSFHQKERLEQADMIIYMDFHRLVCLCNAIKRYVRLKNTSRESMASGCAEKLDAEFIWWIIHKGRTGKIKKQYRKIISLNKDKTVVLKSRKQVHKYLRRIKTSFRPPYVSKRQ